MTTPQPVQEPAGAVEAIMALADAYAEAAQRGEDAMSIARKCAALRSALASLQPVTQAQALLDAATGKTPHVFNGLCPDSIEGHDVRDPDCPACQALMGVTQAKSEAVALLPCPNSFVCAGRCDNRCEEGFAPAAIEKQTHFCQAWGSCDYCAICGKAMPVPTGPVAAPQEAVERQPLTERIALLEAALTEVLEFQSADEGPHIFDWGRWRRIRDNTPPFQRAYPGIGPATQEKQHG